MTLSYNKQSATFDIPSFLLHIYSSILCYQKLGKGSQMVRGLIHRSMPHSSPGPLKRREEPADWEYGQQDYLAKIIIIIVA